MVLLLCFLPSKERQARGRRRLVNPSLRNVDASWNKDILKGGSCFLDAKKAYMTCCSVTTLTLLCNSLAFFRVLAGIFERQVLCVSEYCDDADVLLKESMWNTRSI